MASKGAEAGNAGDKAVATADKTGTAGPTSTAASSTGGDTTAAGGDTTAADGGRATPDGCMTAVGGSPTGNLSTLCAGASGLDAADSDRMGLAIRSSIEACAKKSTGLKKSAVEGLAPAAGNTVTGTPAAGHCVIRLNFSATGAKEATGLTGTDGVALVPTTRARLSVIDA